MPNPTLYDNFSQVRQYIDENNTSYVSKSELSGCGYITSVDVSQMGYMTQAASYAYLSIENLRTNNNRPVQLRATGLQFISSNYSIAPKEISYEYINTSTYNNAWIGNTTLKNYINGRLAEIEASYVTSNTLNSYLSIDNFTKPAGFDTVKLWDTGLSVSTVNGKIYPDWLSYSAVNGSTYNYSFISGGTLKNFVNGRLADIESTYATQSYVADYVAEHGGGGEVTYSYLNDNYLPLIGGNMSGQLTLNNNVKLHIGSARPWDLYEGGSEGTAYLCLQNTIDGKHFYLKDVQGNNIVDIHNNTTGTGAVKLSYNLNTYTNSIVPNSNNTYTLGNENYKWGATYTNRVNFGTNKVYIYNNGDTQLKFGVNNADRFRIDYNTFAPSISNTVTQLGTSNNPFTNTYTSNIWLGASQVYADDYAIDFKVNSNTAARIFSTSIRPWVDNGMTLGSSTTKWSSTYTSYLYTLVDGTLQDLGYYISYNMGDIETLLANI